MAEILKMSYDEAMRLPPLATPAEMEGATRPPVEPIRLWTRLLYTALAQMGLVQPATAPILVESLFALVEGPFNMGMYLALADPDFAQSVAHDQAAWLGFDYEQQLAGHRTMIAEVRARCEQFDAQKAVDLIQEIMAQDAGEHA